MHPTYYGAIDKHPSSLHLLVFDLQRIIQNCSSNSNSNSNDFNSIVVNQDPSTEATILRRCLASRHHDVMVILRP
jgi:hypothetical protein